MKEATDSLPASQSRRQFSFESGACADQYQTGGSHHKVDVIKISIKQAIEGSIQWGRDPVQMSALVASQTA